MPLASVRGPVLGTPVGRHIGGRGRLCPLSLVVFLLILVPLADANPPDPLWVRGVYDAADLDEVVVAISSLAGVVRGVVLVLKRPLDIIVGTAPLSVTALAQSPTPSLVQPRAPPA
jgi:hypothetical protein